ncbi:MAG: hypothetical protein ACLP9S_02630 [Syntrophales bacterium]
MTIKNLSTARVLIVDDKPDEAVPIMTALGKIGVGCVYVRGDKVEELPQKPIEGIRLVFLDMRLDEGGNQKAALSKTISVLKRCVPISTMPLVIVCWTAHAEDIAVFKEMASTEISGLKHGFIVGLPKPLKGKPAKWKVRKEIMAKLKPYDALGLLWQWENVLHRAATETTQTIADVSAYMVEDGKIAANDWQEGIFMVCRELVWAEAGKIANTKTAPIALFHAMNELAIDRMQNAVLEKPPECVDKLIPKKASSLELEHTSLLNQMIMLEPINKRDKTCAPGVILISGEPDFPKHFRKRIGIRRKDELKDVLLDVDRHREVKKMKKEEEKLKSKLSQSPGDAALITELKKIDTERRNLSETITNQCREILIEISSTCDYAQVKRPIARFLAGLAVPEKFAECIKKEDHIYRFDAMKILTVGNVCVLVLSSRYTYALTNPEAKKHPSATYRLRSHALSDLRTWAAFRNARPGSMSIRESS